MEILFDEKPEQWQKKKKRLRDKKIVSWTELIQLRDAAFGEMYCVFSEKFGYFQRIGLEKKESYAAKKGMAMRSKERQYPEK